MKLILDEKAIFKLKSTCEYYGYIITDNEVKELQKYPILVVDLPIINKYFLDSKNNLNSETISIETIYQTWEDFIDKCSSINNNQFILLYSYYK